MKEERILAYDLRQKLPQSRPYLPSYLKVLPFGTVGIVVTALLLSFFMYLRQGSFEKETESMKGVVENLDKSIQEINTDFIALNKRKSVAEQIRGWMDLNPPIQAFILKFVDTLDSSISLERLRIEQSEGQAQMRLIVNFIGNASDINDQFQKTTLHLIDSGFQVAATEFNLIVNGLRYEIVLIYDPHAAAEDRRKEIVE